MDDLVYAQPDVHSNVENGLGYMVASTAKLSHTKPVIQLTEALSFHVRQKNPIGKPNKISTRLL